MFGLHLFVSVSDSWDPVDCSTPGLPVLHHLPEPAHTHVHSCPQSFQHQGLYQCPVATLGTADHPLLIQPLPSFGFRTLDPLGFPPTSLAEIPYSPIPLLLLPLPSLQSPGLCPLVVTPSRRKPMAPNVYRSPAPSFPSPRTQNPASYPRPLPSRLPHLGAEKRDSRPAPHPALPGLLSWLLQRHPPIAQTPE